MFHREFAGWNPCKTVGWKEIPKVAERKMDECFGSWLEMVRKVEVDVVLEAMALTAELEA